MYAIHAAQTTTGAGGGESVLVPFAFLFDIIWNLPSEAISRITNNFETSDSREIASFWLEY